MSPKSRALFGLGLLVLCSAGCARSSDATPAEAAWPIVADAFGARYMQIPCETANLGDLLTAGDTGAGPRCFQISTTNTAAFERDEVLAQIRSDLPDARVVGRVCADSQLDSSEFGPYCDAILFVEPESWNVLKFTYVPTPDDSGYDVYVSSVALEQSNDAFMSSSTEQG